MPGYTELRELFDEIKPVNACPGTVAWLRFIEEKGGKSIRAALFQTNAQGEPLDFCFTRRVWSDSDGQPAIDEPQFLQSLAKTLLKAVTHVPTLILARADELPHGAINEELKVQVPFCRIATSGVPSNGKSDDQHIKGLELLWVAEKPEPDAEAGQLLAEMLDRGNPAEPFERATAGLDVAFGEDRIHAVTNLSGFAVVVSLSSLPEGPEYPTSDYSTIREKIHKASSGPQPDLTLAEHLWAVLAKPPEPLRTIPLHWAGDLMPFQRQGVGALLKNRRLLLADDMGLGKTVQALTALRILRARREIKSCLIAAPASVLNQWRREIEKWAPELSAIIIRGSASDRRWQWNAEKEISLVSYDTLRSDFSTQSLLGLKNWDVVVADEAQRIKNRNDTSEALKGLKRNRSWALTGTPLENREEELASILEFVDYDLTGVARRYRPGAELRRRHRELQVRRKKAEVLKDLPAKQVKKVDIELGPRQRESYDKAEQEGIVYLKSLGEEVNVRHVLELITRLKQICNADPKTGESSKLSDIKDRVDQLAAQGHKTLIFSQYVTDQSGVGAVANRLVDFNPLTITGDVPPHERAEIIERFKTSSEHKVLVLSLRAGGLGLNLQEASYVIHLDRWWNPAVESQAEDRSHRVGQTVKVNVIKYSCNETIEQRIDDILENKRELFNQLIDDVSMDLSTQMNSDELFGLFGLERPLDSCFHEKKGLAQG